MTSVCVYVCSYCVHFSRCVLAAVVIENRLISCCSYCSNEENISLIREATSVLFLQNLQFSNQTQQRETSLIRSKMGVI